MLGVFHNIPIQMTRRMQHLEHADAVDRVDGTPRVDRLRQIPPETGKFIDRFLFFGCRKGSVC